MILERLEVTGFGCLRDLSIELHPRVTVIAGSNESGKSTLHRALRAALYGIDAGGQGRPVDRSDWARYTPWTPSPYGLALTYRLEDGRRIRVARRLDKREQSVQVLELGGSELTDELRSGRSVTPGRFHLGVDEAVFCATAWLSDDGLRLDAPDGAAQRAERLQEAIERLADTRRGVTATQAQARLREAMDRVGSERKLSSPLGVATSRLRTLERGLAEARDRVAAVAGEQERLARLDAEALNLADAWSSAERDRLAARLADLADRRRQLAEAGLDAEHLHATLSATAAHARFPVEREAEVTGLGGELTQAQAAATDARARWEAANERVRPGRARREQIAVGIAAIGQVPDAAAELGERAQRLRGELTAAVATARRDGTGGSRAAALRREIAATGLRRLPGEVIDDLLPLLDAGRRGGARWGMAATLLVVAGAAASTLLARAHVGVAAVLAAVLAVVATAGSARRARWLARRAAAARQAARALAAGGGVDAGELDRLAGRLPALHDLHQALRDEDLRVSGRRADAEARLAGLGDLLDRSLGLAAEAGVPGRPEASATPEGMIAGAEEALRRVDDAAAGSRRRQELLVEDSLLAAEEEACRRLGEDAARATRVAAHLEARLRRLLQEAGVTAVTDPASAVIAYREACTARRTHDEARRRLAEIQRRAGALGGDPVTQERVADDLTDQLMRVGGDPIAAAAATPPEPARLQDLDTAAERARRAASTVAEQARDLRARLSGVLETLPSVADIEDERDACEAARERALRQLRALRLAAELIDAAARVTHRELAPRLAGALGERLAVLTDSRYVEVNVDTEHFAISLLSRLRPDMVALDQVSHGTRDQVALMLRVALCEVLGDAGEPAPLLLDEAGITADPGRREQLLEFLHDLSATHQVLLCTAEPAVVEAMQRAAAGDCGVIRLEAPMERDRARGVEATGRHTARVRVVQG